MNFYITKDHLFDFIPNDYIIPLTFVQRESIMSAATVKSMMGALYAAKIVRIVGLVVLIVLGVLLLILGVILVVKYRKIKRQEDLGIAQPANYKQLVNDSSH